MRKNNKRSKKVGPSKRVTRKTTQKRKNNKRSKKGYYKPKKSRFILRFIIFIIMASAIVYYKAPDSIILDFNVKEQQKEEIKNTVKEVLMELEQEKEQQDIVESVQQDTTPVQEPVQELVKETTQVTSRGGMVRDYTTLTGYRITSYHPGDGCATGTKTGSGKTIYDFGTKVVSGKTVYTYQGKIVVACATEELLNSGYNVNGGGTRQEGKYYFRYYDTLKINIDGTYYDAIVLDSCGASMWQGEKRIDIFVPNSSNIINRSNVTAKI